MTDNFDNEQLENLLRDEEPYISNDGFSDRVVSALPRRRRLTWRIKRRIVKGVSAFAAIGTLLAILLSNGYSQEVLEITTNPLFIPVAMIGIFVTIGAACVWVMSDRA